MTEEEIQKDDEEKLEEILTPSPNEHTLLPEKRGPTGWVCPNCGTGVAPWCSSCPNCTSWQRWPVTVSKPTG